MIIMQNVHFSKSHMSWKCTCKGSSHKTFSSLVSSSPPQFNFPATGLEALLDSFSGCTSNLSLLHTAPCLLLLLPRLTQVTASDCASKTTPTSQALHATTHVLHQSNLPPAQVVRVSRAHVVPPTPRVSLLKQREYFL